VSAADAERRRTERDLHDGAQLLEDRVDVLLDGRLGHHEGRRDRGVVLPLRHLRQDLALPGRQLGEL
jgi:hypothetical protein